MRQSIYLFLVFYLIIPTPSFGQPATSAAKLLVEERGTLLHQFNRISSDSIMVYRLSRLFESKVDTIYTYINSNSLLTVAEKDKAIRSLAYFINALNKNITQQKLDMYDLPGAIESYKVILIALLNHKPYTDHLTPLGPRRSQLMATAFAQYDEYLFLDDIAVYKRLAASPEFILRFLENKPFFRFADSLLVHAAAHDPMKMISYLSGGKAALKDLILNTKNIYVRQIVSLAGNKNASELLPFVTQLADQTITQEEILEKRKDVTSYFHLLVNTLKESEKRNDPSFVLQKILRNGIKEKSLSFYAYYINEQHSAPDARRFVVVKDLRPEDLYYIITSCGEELYTSSYLGLYKRLMEHFKMQQADSLFDIVQYDNFRTFMRLAANYNVMANFLSNMSLDSASTLLNRFISGIETDTNSGLEKAMDIADSFTGLDAGGAITSLVQNELESNLNRSKTHLQYFGIRLYSILLQVFDLVVKKHSLSNLWTKLGNYEMLERSALQNKNGEIIELVLFYGDDDGIASFNNFYRLFADTSKWNISKNDFWITVRSRADEPVVIYANLPLDNKQEMDLRAQDSLANFLREQSLAPSVLIHRGHSYHLGHTLNRLKPSIKLAILGSCGSFNSAISIASISPDAQFIGSKKTGSKSINDPIIEVINEALLNKKDLSWTEIWENLRARFGKDELTLTIFNEYIPPGKNVSLFVLKLFNYYNRPVGSTSVALGSG